MEQTIQRVMEIVMVIVMTWTAFMFAKCMRIATYHPEAMDKKADSKE